MRKLLLSFAALAAVSAFIYADETVTDACGNTYPVVTIGSQMWMAENLKCEKYGTESEAYNASWLTNNTLPTSGSGVYTPYFVNATDNTKWSTTYVSYAGNLTSEQIAKLGYLYNWAAAIGVEDGQNQTSDFSKSRQGICPNGWHIPTRDEWQELYNYIYDNQSLSSNDVGKYLKTTSGWYDGDEYHKPGTNSYGFTVLPSGYANGLVHNVGSNAYFWTATLYDNNNNYVYDIFLDNNYDYLNDKNGDKFDGLSVRCLKNNPTSANEAEADAATTTYKVIENGQVIIVAGNKKFNLQGVEIK